MVFPSALDSKKTKELQGEYCKVICGKQPPQIIRTNRLTSEASRGACAWHPFLVSSRRNRRLLEHLLHHQPVASAINMGDSLCRMGC